MFSDFGLIIGLLALTGSVHFVLSNSLNRDVLEFYRKRKKKSKLDDFENPIILRIMNVHLFLAISNGMVMLIFSYFIIYIFSKIIFTGRLQNPWFFFIILTITIVLLFILTKIFKSILNDIRVLDLDIYRTLFDQRIKFKIPKEGKNRIFINILTRLFNIDKIKTSYKNIVLFFILLIGYFVLTFSLIIFALFISKTKRIDIIISTYNIYFSLVSIGCFMGWFFSFWLRPLRNIYELLHDEL